MSCNGFDPEWEELKALLIRSYFSDEPIERGETPSLLDVHRYLTTVQSPPRHDIMSSGESSSSPLPDLIIEIEPNRHDDPEECYRKIHRKIIKAYRRLFIEGRSEIGFLSTSPSDIDMTGPEHSAKYKIKSVKEADVSGVKQIIDIDSTSVNANNNLTIDTEESNETVYEERISNSEIFSENITLKDNKRKCSSKEISTDGINGNAKKTCKDLTQTDSSSDLDTHRVITFQADVHREGNYIKSPILRNKGNKRYNFNINTRLNFEDLPVPKQKDDSDNYFFNLINQERYNIEVMRSPVILRRSSAGSIQSVPPVHDSPERTCPEIKISMERARSEDIDNTSVNANNNLTIDIEESNETVYEERISNSEIFSENITLKDNKRKCPSKEISTDGINDNAKKTCKDLTQTDSSSDLDTHRVITFQADVHREENYIKSPILRNKGNKRYNFNINTRLNFEDLPVPKQKDDSDNYFFNLINQERYNIEVMRSPVIPRRSSAGSIQGVPPVHDSPERTCPEIKISMERARSEENSTQEELKATTWSKMVESVPGLEAEENSVSGAESKNETQNESEAESEVGEDANFEAEKLESQEESEVESETEEDTGYKAGKDESQDSDNYSFDWIFKERYDIEEMRSPRRSSVSSIQNGSSVYDSPEKTTELQVKSGVGLETEREAESKTESEAGENSVSRAKSRDEIQTEPEAEKIEAQGESSSLPDPIIEKKPKKHFDPEKLFQIIRKIIKKPNNSHEEGLEAESETNLIADLQAELEETEEDVDSGADKIESQASGVESDAGPPKSAASKRRSTCPKKSYNKRARRESSELKVPKNTKLREFILRQLKENFFLGIPRLCVVQPISSSPQDISIADESLGTSLFGNGYADNVQSSSNAVLARNLVMTLKEIARRKKC